MDRKKTPNVGNLGYTTVGMALQVLGDDFEWNQDEPCCRWIWHFKGYQVIIYPYERIAGDKHRVHLWIECTCCTKEVNERALRTHYELCVNYENTKKRKIA